MGTWECVSGMTSRGLAKDRLSQRCDAVRWRRAIYERASSSNMVRAVAREGAPTPPISHADVPTPLPYCAADRAGR